MPDVEDLRDLWEIDLELVGSDQGPIPIITTVAEKTWIWSDLHLGDPGALQAFDRPFGDVDQMTSRMEAPRTIRRHHHLPGRRRPSGCLARPAPGARHPRLPGQPDPRARKPRPEPRRVARGRVYNAVLAGVVRHRPAAGPEPLPAAPDTGGLGQPSRTPPRRYRADPATHQPRGRADGLQPGRTHLGAGQGATATARRTVDSRRLGERSVTSDCTNAAPVTTGPSQLTEWGRYRTPDGNAESSVTATGHPGRMSSRGWRRWSIGKVRPRRSFR